MARQLRPESWELLEKPIEDGKTAAADGGPDQEFLSQCPQTVGIAGKIDEQSRPGRGDTQPVVHEQRQSQRAALGDTRETVDIVKAEGQNTAAENREQSFSDMQKNHSFAERLRQFPRKVKKWKKEEADMDKIAKLGQGFLKETIENGCHIWYNLGVFLWQHNRKEL